MIQALENITKCVTMNSITQKWKDKSNTNDDERNEDFKCETCGKSFSQKSGLSTHMKKFCHINATK